MNSVSPVAIDAAFLDKRLLGAAFDDLTTWRTWLAVLKAGFAMQLTPGELELFNAVAGGRGMPAERVRELWVVAGRRSGKSRVAAALAVFFACFVPYRVARGERPMVLVLAMSQDQATTVLGYVKGFLTESPVLRREIESVTRSSITLRNGVTVAVHANSFRSVRGRTLLACILDEVAFWRDEATATPDVEVYTAVLPSLATTGGMLIGISSPYRKIGLLAGKYRDFYGHDDDRVLVIQAPTTVLNPALPQAEIAAQQAADPTAARSEWDAEFRSDLASYLTDDLIDRAINHSRPLELPPLSDLFYRCFVDAAGGVGHDAYTISVGHREGNTTVIDLVRATTGAFDPQTITEQYAKLARQYRCYTVTGDRCGAEWVRSAWERTGITYVPSEISKSQIYLEALPSFTTGQVELPDHPRLIRELRLLERTTGRNRDVVDHPRGQHDDCANAVAGVLRVLSDHLGDPDLAMWKRAWGDPKDVVDPGVERARIAERRFREEVLAKICRPPEPPFDLVAQIARLKAQRRNACFDD